MDNFDLKKYLAEGKLLNEFIGGELEKRNEALYNKLVPGSGAADTVEGEMLRAMNRLIYRYYNDGDKYFEGYGTETAGPAHSFLVNADHPQKLAMIKLFTEPRGDSEYEQMLKDALDVILDHIESRQGNYTENSEDMLKYEPEFEDEEEDDDWDDYHGRYGYDDEDEDEDIYENESKKLTEAFKERLNSLRDELFFATDPDRDDYDSYEGREPEEIRADIRSEFGDKIADQIEDGEYEMHFPRDKGVPGFQSNDKLADKQQSFDKYRITKSGKMNKQDLKRRKNYLKRGY